MDNLWRYNPAVLVEEAMLAMRITPPTAETIVWPIGAIIVYLLVLYVLTWFMRDRKPLDSALKWPLVIHNYLLCVFSLVMSIGVGRRAYIILMREGWYNLYCGTTPGIEGPYDADCWLFWWALLFYYSKYYELLDTVFLVLRKRPLSFLHVYHHASVLIVCWFALYEHIVMGWITCFNNATVHVIMYFYYAEQARGSGPFWWRKYITSIQMLQFILDSGTSMFFLYFHLMGIPCRGTLQAWLLANFVGISFFFLFLNFYRQNYTAAAKKKEGTQSQRPTTIKQHANGKQD